MPKKSKGRPPPQPPPPRRVVLVATRRRIMLRACQHPEQVKKNRTKQKQSEQIQSGVRGLQGGKEIKSKPRAPHCNQRRSEQVDAEAQPPPPRPAPAPDTPGHGQKRGEKAKSFLHSKGQPHPHPTPWVCPGWRPWQVGLGAFRGHQKWGPAP